MRESAVLRRWFSLLFLLAGAMMLLVGCSFAEEKMKLRDLDFTVLSAERIPEELKNLLEQKKEEPFQITYTDTENLFLCIGYGKQHTGGYSIAIDELYLTEDNICVKSCLLGPKAEEKVKENPSYPYIVLRTELLEKPVIFE